MFAQPRPTKLSSSWLVDCIGQGLLLRSQRKRSAGAPWLRPSGAGATRVRQRSRTRGTAMLKQPNRGAGRQASERVRPRAVISLVRTEPSSGARGAIKNTRTPGDSFCRLLWRRGVAGGLTDIKIGIELSESAACYSTGPMSNAWPRLFDVNKAMWQQRTHAGDARPD